MSEVVHDPKAIAVAVLLFEQVELLDFAGPFEVLAVAGRPDGPLRFRVSAVATAETTVRSRCGPRLVADATLDDLDTNPPRVVIVPGGFGVRALLEDGPFLDTLRRLHDTGTIVCSVCTGAWLLAKAGFLDGREATTHHLGLDRLAELAPTCTVCADRRVVDTGDVITSAGVAAGMDLGFHLIARFCGPDLDAVTRRYVEA